MGKCGKHQPLDAIKKREIIAILSVGCSRRAACRYVGCSWRTIQKTAERDSDFAEGLRQAEERLELTQLKNIAAAARKPQYWRAAAWVLERTRPQEYAARGPDMITRDQISRLLLAFVQIVAEEVPVAKYRQGVAKRLDALAKEFGCPPFSEGAEDEPDQ